MTYANQKIFYVQAWDQKIGINGELMSSLDSLTKYLFVFDIFRLWLSIKLTIFERFDLDLKLLVDPYLKNLVQVFNLWYNKERRFPDKWHEYFRDGYVYENIYNEVEKTQQFSVTPEEVIYLRNNSDAIGNFSFNGGGNTKNSQKKNTKLGYAKLGYKFIDINGKKTKKMIWKSGNRHFIRNKQGIYEFVYKRHIL